MTSLQQTGVDQVRLNVDSAGAGARCFFAPPAPAFLNSTAPIPSDPFCFVSFTCLRLESEFVDRDRDRDFADVVSRLERLIQTIRGGFAFIVPPRSEALPQAMKTPPPLSWSPAAAWQVKGKLSEDLDLLAHSCAEFNQRWDRFGPSDRNFFVLWLFSLTTRISEFWRSKELAAFEKAHQAPPRCTIRSEHLQVLESALVIVRRYAALSFALEEIPRMDFPAAIAGTPEPTGDGKPHWNHRTGELRFRGILCRKFGRHAPMQFPILNAFQRLGWPSEMKTPFRFDRNSEKLRTGVRGLVHSLGKNAPISFRVEKAQVLWEPRLSEENTTLIIQ